MLRAVEAVQAGARALDATDAICAQGHGIAARSRQRTGASDVTRARTGVQNLPTLVTNYRAALSSLDKARTAVSGTARSALENVVRDGQREAKAVAQFQAVVRSAWQQYVSLDGQERLWIKRAVTPWYRTDKEAADAYAVLVQPGRHFLVVARTQLARASAALQTPTAVQSATLAAANRALATLHPSP
ncbi:MAG: hypothetical protein ABR549_04810 [Mycobacteriales bacterium]